MNRCFLAMTILITTLSGCGWKGDPLSLPTASTSPTASPSIAPTSAHSAASPSDKSHWVIQPAQIRLYPTTRFTSPHAPCELDLRVEMLDELGDSIKAVGDWRIELHSSSNASGTPLLSWEIPMRTREQNLQYYDRITRSYQLRLKVDRMADDQQPMWLSVTLMPPQGHRWQTQGMIDPNRGLMNP